MNGITITYRRGTVDIYHKDMVYSLIKKMYKKFDGLGVQLTKELEPHRDEITKQCTEIADSVVKLQALLSEQTK